MSIVGKDVETNTSSLLSDQPTGDQRAESVAKFTPGPWRLTRCDDGYLMVCTAGDTICHPDSNHPADDEADAANFRLIAAAPEMLEALRLVTGLLENARIMLAHNGLPTSYEQQEAIQEARAAIARAHGNAAEQVEVSKP